MSGSQYGWNLTQLAQSAVTEMVNMGYGMDDALSALQKVDFDIERAYDVLLNDQREKEIQEDNQVGWNNFASSLGRSAADSLNRMGYGMDEAFGHIDREMRRAFDDMSRDHKGSPPPQKKVEKNDDGVRVTVTSQCCPPPPPPSSYTPPTPAPSDPKSSSNGDNRDNGSISSGSSRDSHSTPYQQQQQGNMSGNARVVPVQLIRNRSIDDFNEQIVHMLDDIERRVEQLRETAGLLEQEKESILDMLSNFNLNTELLRLGQGDREDINATANRLMSRAKAVEVVVSTPRNEEQQKALSQVNTLIEGMITKMTDDLSQSKETCRRFLNACSPDQPEGPIDQRFQTSVIECTADDQKKIRRKLAQIITQIERAERTCMPQW